MAAQIDPRGPQFAAALTVVVLAAVLLVAPHPAGIALLAVQAGLFALGALAGVQRTPHAWLFATFVRPRLGPPSELEDAAPPRFAQAVGLVFALVGLVGYLAGAPLVGAIAVGFALAAALLNAAFAFCLGCEVYLLLRRVLPAPEPRGESSLVEQAERRGESSLVEQAERRGESSLAEQAERRGESSLVEQAERSEAVSRPHA